MTQIGDYTDIVGMERNQLERKLEKRDEQERIFGLFLGDEFIGTVSLIQYEATVFGLGYWIGQRNAGKGYMTEAVRSVIGLAKDKFGATEIWAGIKPNNTASIRLVRRLGFQLAREQPVHQSYRLNVSTSDGEHQSK